MLDDLMVALSRVVHSIVCCRILLNLRQAGTPRGASTILESINLQFATLPERETDRGEVIQLEAHDTRNDGGDSRRQDEELARGHG